MKQLLVYCLVALLPSMKALAYDFESDGIYYTITGSNTVSVVSGDYAYDGDVTVPQAVGLSGKTYLVTAIGENAFKSTTTLESVTLPEGLVVIGNEAFRGSGVKTVSLPSTLTSMGTGAFRECKSLTGMVLPDVLKDIKEYTFSECTNLKTLSLGNQIETIEKYAFNGIAIENLSIPQTMKSIGQYAFDNCALLKVLTIDNAKVSIGGRAFGQCKNLIEVNLGNEVIELGTITEYSSYTQYERGAFWNCTNLTSITIPSSLTAIGSGSFMECSRLREVDLPSTIVYIGNYAFSSTSIETIALPSSLTTIGVSAFYSCPIREIAFPNGLVEIGAGAFAGCALQNISFPVSVTKINDGAFSGCKNLKSVIIENAPVTLFGAFQGCSALESVDLGTSLLALNRSVTSGSGYGVGGCFENCTSLKSIVLPNTLQELSINLFSGCTSLSDVKLPNSLLSIETQCFWGCKSLTSIELPNTVQTLVGSAFYDCSALKHVVLSASLKTIGSSSFYGCKSLEDIVIPESVTSIGDGAFLNCIGLKSVIIDNAVTIIGNRAFNGCSSLTTLDLGKTTSIGNLVFENCTSLENVVIPNSVQSLGYAFPGCTALKKAVIGTGLKTIDGHYSLTGLFSNCSRLSEVEIKSQVLTAIGDYCFYNCRSLKKTELPSSVTSIGKSSFEGCTTLSHIYMNATTPPAIQSSTFSDYATPTLHVPSSAKTAYTKADNWKQFTNIVAIGSEPKATAEEIAALDALLGDAQALYNAAVEGTEPGNYRAGAKAALKAVITEVSGRVNENMLTEDVEDCTELLNTAIKSFKNKQVKNEYQTDNTLAFAGSLKASRGAEFRLPIEMNNVNEISAVQFDLYLPEGMLLSKDELGDYQIELGDRTTSRSHSVSSRVMSDGALRVVISSTQNATFTGNNGTLLSLVLFPQTIMEAGDYDVELKNIVLTDPQATRYAAADMKSVITVSAYTLGDVNNDTHIDVADLTGVVLFILENADANLVFNAADMDGNGVVEVNDYAALVNVILAQNVPASSRMFGQSKTTACPNTIGISDLNLNENGEGELQIHLVNKNYAYSGMQFDLYLPEGIVLNEKEAMATSRHHGVWTQKHADGYYRIVCSSMLNAELNEGIAIRLQVKGADNTQGSYQVMADNVVLSDVNAQRHEAANANALLTIGGESTGIITIEAAKRQKNVYDMQGRRADAVKKGVYVVNGKKVVVR